MRSSTIEPSVWRLLGRRVQARLAQAGERAASAARDAKAASAELDAACAELARIDRESLGAREALRARIEEGAKLMSRNDFERLDHAHTRLMARRSHACPALDKAKNNRDTAVTALAQARDAWRRLLLQREKYRLAERLSEDVRIDAPI